MELTPDFGQGMLRMMMRKKKINAFYTLTLHSASRSLQTISNTLRKDNEPSIDEKKNISKYNMTSEEKSHERRSE